MGLKDLLNNLISDNSPTTNNEDELINNISNEVSNILDSNNLIINFCSLTNNAVCYGIFKSEIDGEIQVNTDFFNIANEKLSDEKFLVFQNKIREFINFIFDKGYHFENPNLDFIDKILYGNKEDLLKYMSEKNQNGILASNIIPIDSNGKINRKRIFTLYKSIKVSKPNEKGEGEIEFNEIIEDDFRKLFGFALNLEISEKDFFTGMWKDFEEDKDINIIRYGLHTIYEAIKKVCNEKGSFSRLSLNGTKIPYKIKAPKQAIDDTIKEEINLSIKRKPIEDKTGKINLKQYETIIPEIKKGQVLLTYKKGEKGEYGIALNGEIIVEGVKIEGNKIDIKNIIHSGSNYIEVVQNGDSVIFIAKEDVFVTKKGDLSKGGYLDFSKNIKIKSPIDTTTGNIILTSPMMIELASTSISPQYGIQCSSINITGTEIYGFVRTEKDIFVKSSRISHGEITSLKGNITIGTEGKGNEHVAGGKINAPLGKITIYGNVEHSIIMADEVEIVGKAINSTIIGKKVKITEVDKASKIIGGNIDVEKNNPSNSDYIIVLSNAMSGRENQLKFLNERKSKVEGQKKVQIEKSIEMLLKMEELFKRIYGENDSSVIFNIKKSLSSESDYTKVKILSHTFSFSQNPIDTLNDLRFLLEISKKESKDFIDVTKILLANKNRFTKGKSLEILQNHYLGESNGKQRSDLRRVLVGKKVIPVNLNSLITGTMIELSERGCIFTTGKDVTGINKGDILDISFKYEEGKIKEEITSPLLVINNNDNRITGVFLFAGVETKLSRILTSLEAL